MEKTYYAGTTSTDSNGLSWRFLTDDHGFKVCKASFMRDSKGNAIVVDLDTPEFCRGRGFARELLSQMRKRETTKSLRVISNDHARSYYEKLGYTEIAPNIFQAN